ncbi:Uncharacterised protein [Enterobacter cloacae]|nr:hypothetical protein AI2797V1_3419 [Enterobacter cloacae]CAE7820786.1 hypothetical protein AI2802V1_3404 [Enterobacter cloacae]CAH3817261.1 hypothetical protein AI2797V1_3419 [Enterobacter cloacae]CAH4003804.1 hypothetical protein AI2802V1_3404 [Enterobacter cloacae]SAE77267.1 Uncharacterised protein [Enterobacter cloacae]
MIPVRAMVTIVNQQMSIQHRSKTLCMPYPGMMTNHNKLKICLHHYG